MRAFTPNRIISLASQATPQNAAKSFSNLSTKPFFTSAVSVEQRFFSTLRQKNSNGSLCGASTTNYKNEMGRFVVKTTKEFNIFARYSSTSTEATSTPTPTETKKDSWFLGVQKPGERVLWNGKGEFTLWDGTRLTVPDVIARAMPETALDLILTTPLPSNRVLDETCKFQVLDVAKEAQTPFEQRVKLLERLVPKEHKVLEVIEYTPYQQGDKLPEISDGVFWYKKAGSYYYDSSSAVITTPQNKPLPAYVQSINQDVEYFAMQCKELGNTRPSCRYCKKKFKSSNGDEWIVFTKAIYRRSNLAPYPAKFYLCLTEECLSHAHQDNVAIKSHLTNKLKEVSFPLFNGKVGIESIEGKTLPEVQGVEWVKGIKPTATINVQ